MGALVFGDSVAGGTVGGPFARLDKRVLKVCDEVGSFIEYWGFKAIHGRVWTLLAISDGPLSQIEIAERLGVSRSLISTVMSELVEYGLVRAVSQHRNAPYEAVIDVWPTISDVLRQREWMLLESARNSLEAAREEAELAGEGHAYRIERIQLLLTMTELAQALLKVLIAIRMPRSLDGFSDWITRAGTLVKSLRGRD